MCRVTGPVHQHLYLQIKTAREKKKKHLEDIEVDDEGVVGVVVVGPDESGAGGVARVRDALVELPLDDGVAVGRVLQEGAQHRLLVPLHGPNRDQHVHIQYGSDPSARAWNVSSSDPPVLCPVPELDVLQPLHDLLVVVRPQELGPLPAVLGRHVHRRRAAPRVGRQARLRSVRRSRVGHRIVCSYSKFGFKYSCL